MTAQWWIAGIAVFIAVASLAVNCVALKELRASRIQLDWLRETLIPWMNNIGNHINPSHTTLPGDIT